MALNLFRQLATVILLVTAYPLLAQAQIDAATLSAQGFSYSAEWSRRIQKTTNDRGGGGVIDGGGGNMAPNGELLDEYSRTDLTKLETKAFRVLVETHFGSRLKSLEAEMPGFISWLTSAYKLPWYLDPKALNPEMCKNSSMHAGKNTIAACQDMRRVHVNKTWYQERIEKKPRTVAALVVHELVRYHVIRLAKVSLLSRSEQDGITEEVTAAILFDTAVSDVKPLLISTGLLLNDHEVYMRRMQMKLDVIKGMTKSMKQINEFIRMCPEFPRSRRQGYYDLFISYLEMHEKEIAMYKKLSTPEELAKDESDHAAYIPVAIQRMQIACSQ